MKRWCEADIDPAPRIQQLPRPLPLARLCRRESIFRYQSANLSLIGRVSVADSRAICRTRPGPRIVPLNFFHEKVRRGQDILPLQFAFLPFALKLAKELAGAV